MVWWVARKPLQLKDEEHAEAHEEGGPCHDGNQAVHGGCGLGQVQVRVPGGGASAETQSKDRYCNKATPVG